MPNVSPMTDPHRLLPGIPLVESPFFDDVLRVCNFDSETARVAIDLNQSGYAVVRFDDLAIEERAERIKSEHKQYFDFADWCRKDWPQGIGMRTTDTWKTSADVRAIAANEYMQRLLSAVFGRRAWPFQTLIFPVGSQQHYHSDSVHFSSIPERFMCGVWLALEDVHEDAGPLVYYPGSHKWPILYNDLLGVRITGNEGRRTQSVYEPVWEALVAKHGLKPMRFLPKKGEALIWLANLLHGGARQRDPGRTRWSQVTHYFFDNCCYITPMLSDVLIGRLFLRDIVDISSGEPVPNIYVDVPLSKLQQPAQIVLPADFDGTRYLQLNLDVANAGADPAEHYLAFGAREGRRYR
jgi:hypothetical protein